MSGVLCLLALVALIFICIYIYILQNTSYLCAAATPAMPMGHGPYDCAVHFAHFFSSSNTINCSLIKFRADRFSPEWHNH